MSRGSSQRVVSNAANEGEKLVHVARNAAASPGFEWLARFGSAAVGVGYILIGILAGASARGGSSQAPNQQGALDVVYYHPFGRFILGAAAICVFAYAIYRGARAFTTYGKPSSRIASLFRGVVYAVVAYAALRLAVSGHQTGSGSAQNVHQSTAKVMGLPFGPEIVILIGVVVIGIGLYQIYKAYASKLDRILALSKLSETVRKAIIALGRVGLAARGAVFMIIGAFLIVAGIHHNPGQSRGMAGALHSLQSRPYGSAILSFIAAGLVAYGLYSIVSARYRDFSPSAMSSD